MSAPTLPPSVRRPQKGPVGKLAELAKTKLNLLRLYHNYRSASPTVPVAYPDRLYIEITNVCNLACVMCPTGRGTLGRAKGHMRLDLFQQIIDEMAPHVKTTTLHVWGEPLLNPNFIAMVEYATARGIRVSASTNATMLDAAMAERIIRSGLDRIYLCLDGMNAATYESIRRKADFEVTKANIERYIELSAKAQGSRPTTIVQIVEMAATADQTAEFRRHWHRPGVDRVDVKAFDTWGNQDPAITQLERPEAREREMPDRPHCPLLWYHCNIFQDGTITCCDRDFSGSYPLGNVREAGGVMKVWNGPKMQELRRKHISRQLSDVAPCRNCKEWAWWRPTPLRAHGNAPSRSSSE